jgi:hypothetical protein
VEAQDEEDEPLGHAMNLIERVQELRANGKIGNALKELESQL